MQEDGPSSSDEDEEGAGSSMEVGGSETNNTQPRKGREGKKTRGMGLLPLLSFLPTAPLRTLRKTGTVARIIFLDSSSLANAISPASKARSWPSSEEPRGLADAAASQAM